MKSWEPNKLVQDDADVAYEPTDTEGAKLARQLTLELRLIMWNVKMGRPPRRSRDWQGPGQTPNCRCVIRPIYPPQE